MGIGKTIALGIAVAFVAYFFLYAPSRREYNRISSIQQGWAQLRDACKSTDPDQVQKKCDLVIKFKDGDFLALVAHSFHEDSDFYTGIGDYALGLSGKGRRIFTDSYHFCGYEGLCGDLTHKDYGDFSDFLKQTAQFGWTDANIAPGH
jgi:hypothetical protein